jgi:hypothetical protein
LVVIGFYLAKKMRLASRAVASIARALGSSGLRLALLHRQRPLFAILRHPPISSPVTSPEASKAPNNKSKFTGMSWKCDTKKWSAQISIEGDKKYLGKRTLSPARHVLEDTSHQIRPKIDAGDASLLMGSIH